MNLHSKHILEQYFKFEMFITYRPILVMFLGYIIISTMAEGIKRNSLTNSVNQKTKPSNLSDKYQIGTLISNGTKENCVINVSQTDLFLLEQLARSKVVHYVELNFHFSSSISNSVAKAWRWRMTNNVGKEILSLLALEYIHVSCTLDVGRKTKHVNVTDDPSGCTAAQKDIGVLVAETIVKQLSSEKEICFEEVSNISTQTRCCKSIGKDPVKYDCSATFAESKFLNVLESILSVQTIIVRLLLFPVVVYIGIFLQSKTTNNIKGYYQLTESRMSPSSILSMLFWDGYGKIKSFLRRCLLIGLLFLLFCEVRLFDKLNKFDLFFGVWAFLYPFSKLFSHSYDASECSSLSRCCQEVFSCLHYNIDDVLLLGRENMLGAVCLITLPFNIKRWEKMFLHFFPKEDDHEKLSVCSRNAALFLVYFVLVFIMQIMFVLLFTLDCYLSVLLKLLRSIVNGGSEQNYLIRVVMFLVEFYCLFFTVYFLIYALQHIPGIAISLLSGLLLNVAYFFPYFVLVSILVFYSWMYWTYVEEQYVVLMTLIFEENVKHKLNKKLHATVTSKTITTTITTLSTEPTTRKTVTTSKTTSETTPETTPATTPETTPATATTTLETTTTTPLATMPAITTPCNNGNNAENNDDDGCFKCGICRNQNEVDIDGLTETVCVVSQEVYDSIRKRLLPYHGNLFRFGLNILGISVFAVFSLTLVQVLQASDVSPTIQLFTTFSVGAFPYIMNIVAAQKGEKQKDAWEKQLKHCVESLVKKIAGDKPDLRLTEFFIKHPDQNVGEVRESDV